MTNLKTLKDFYFDDENGDFYSCELRQEAIKWVKYCDVHYSILGTQLKYHCKIAKQENKCPACKIFIVFFNLTKEDLE